VHDGRASDLLYYNYLSLVVHLPRPAIHQHSILYFCCFFVAMALLRDTIPRGLGSAQQMLAIIRWKLNHFSTYRREDEVAPQDVRECWRFLALTSRSFAAVVQQLHPELLMPVCVFYLILRALDTIEDDMTIDITTKEPMLREFATHIDDDTWTFNGSGPNEKDRELLVQFDCVSREYNKLKVEYKEIIADITIQMANGMADFAVRAEAIGVSSGGVSSIADYELYCHFVAGVVGDGVSRMFVVAEFTDASLLSQPELIESMGQHLQQTNIIRDVHEDHLQNRHFWPKDIWGKYVNDFGDLFEVQNREKALHCSSEMILNAIRKSGDCLRYIAAVKEQSVFNFVAIPQSMAIATLELCFRNPAIFERNIKISRGSACQLMLQSTRDIRPVCQIFVTYATRIQAKNHFDDPHYKEIKIACEEIRRSALIILSEGRQPLKTDERYAVARFYRITPTIFLACASFTLVGLVTAMIVSDLMLYTPYN
jgi:farnesyl-diphosphate farnesyltransferase